MSDFRPAPRAMPPCGCGTPGRADPATCYCGVEDLLRIIRRRYSLAVMNVMHTRGGAHYHDIAAALPQASSSTLVVTLQALVAARLVIRQELFDASGRHVRYTVAPSGAQLLARLRSLLDEVQPSRR